MNPYRENPKKLYYLIEDDFWNESEWDAYCNQIVAIVPILPPANTPPITLETIRWQNYY
jgi:hypothetical protein